MMEGSDARTPKEVEVGEQRIGKEDAVPPPAPRCLNCGSALSGNYCGNCGQRASATRLDWKWLLHELQHGVLHVDRGILFTLKELFTRPGATIRGYLEGRRKQHFPPFGLLMLLAAAGVFVTSSLELDKLLSAQMSTADPSTRQFNAFFTKHQSLFYLGMLPFMATGTWLCMRKYGHGFVEHVVINTFIGIQIATVSLVTWPLVLMVHDVATITMLANAIMFTLTLWTLVRLYHERPWWRVLLRALAAFALSMLFLLVAVVVGVVVAYAMGAAGK